MNELDKIWDYLVEYEIASSRELQLVTKMNGYNEDTLNSVIYVRTGYHDLEQLIECEG